MIRAYVTAITTAGSSPEAVERIRELDGVTEAHVVAGACDVVAELEVETTAALREVVTGDIQRIRGVGTTRTYVVVE